MNYWNEYKTEVRYHMLRPDEAVARREAFPVAWVPLGTIEWHGCQNPLGSDTLQAEGICVIAARMGGGLVMPPVYFGDARVGGEIIETLPQQRNDLIANEMHLPLSNFDDDKFPTSKEEQLQNYRNLLLHIQYQLQSLGFKVCVLVTGHYPLEPQARRAAAEFGARGNRMISWSFVDYTLISDKYDYAGDHAAYWETSHMLSLYPDRVDLGKLPPKGEPLIGIVPNKGRLPQDADAEFGYRIMEEAAEIAIAETKHRLENPDLYRGEHCIETGKWRG
jgi:creatinine amidohydrolase